MRKYLVLFLIPLYLTSPSLAADSAVIIMYHRFGEENYPNTNIRLTQLEQHINELKTGLYNVMPVSKILSSIQKNKPLPERTVGITVDDAYKSVYEEAWPRFKASGLPFTVFVSTGMVDDNAKGHLNWDQVREMQNGGVEFGAHTVSHLHMTNTQRFENEAEIFKSNSRISVELGKPPTLFAYPYGEASSEVFDIISSSGYKFAFGQHSGVVHKSSNMIYLPRFSLNERYGNLKRFKLVVNALPFPVSGFTPQNPLLAKANPPNVGFTVGPALKSLNRISCFTNNEGRVSTTVLGSSRIEVRMAKPFTKKRTRLNCTLPGPNNRWRWLGALFVLPSP